MGVARTDAALTTTQASEETDQVTANSASLNEPEDTSTNSHTPDWVARCPYCDTANEYGYVMCDPVLPRICQNGDDNGRGDEESESDVALYKVLSTFA